MSEPIEENISPLFTDSDTSDIDLPEGAVRYFLNCSVASPINGGIGTVSNKNGNVLVSFSLPDGDNIVIGQYEDPLSTSVFYFVFNSNANHQILRYFSETNIITPILLWSGLAFYAQDITKRDFLITGVSFIDNMLYWTDNYNGQRKINVEKAAIKPIVANIYFGTTIDNTYIPVNTYYFTYNTTTFNLMTVGNRSSLSELCDLWALNFNNEPSLSVNFTATSFGNYVQITAKDNTQWNLSASLTGTGICQLIYQNAYPNPFVEDYISLAKYPPIVPPTFTYQTDTTTSQNYIQQFVGQFRYRYVYDDYEFSTWSPYSKLAAPDNPDINYIEIDFGNSRLGSPVSSIIRRVEIGYRNFNETVNYFLVSLEQWQYVSGKYRFYNEGNQGVIDESEVVLANHAVPLKSQSLSIIKGFLMLGGNTEGYDPIQVNASVKLGFNPTIVQKKWTIMGNLRIINRQNGVQYSGDPCSYNQPIHWNGSDIVFGGMGQYNWSALGDPFDNYEPGTSDLFDQRIPDKGFYIYLAGTNYKGLSQQTGYTFYTASSEQIGYPIDPLAKKITATITVDEKLSSPLVFDSSQFGAAPALKNSIVFGQIYETHRQALRRLLQFKNTYSTYQITDVIPGEYIMRVASHWVSKGDKAGKGKMYDVDNGLAWQQTSTNVYTMLELTNTGTEVLIGLSEDGKTFTLNGTSFTTTTPYVVDLSLIPGGGTILIEDLTTPYATNALIRITPGQAMVGYLMDAIDPTTLTGGSTSAADIATAIAMESQQVAIDQQFFLGHAFVYTDHNGYFYFSQIPKTTRIFGGSLDGFFVGANNNTLISNKQGIYKAGLNDLRNGLSAQLAQGYWDNTNAQTEYIAINLNPTGSAEGSTLIEGKIIDSDNVPLKNALITLQYNGRPVLTASDGSFSIRGYGYAHGSPHGQNNITGSLIFSFPLFTQGFYVSGNLIFAININIGSGYYDITHIYTIPNQAFVIDYTVNTSFLKRGGIYQYGLIHFDNSLRPFPLFISDDLKIKIPFYTEDLHNYDPITYPDVGTFNYSTPHISWSINSKPPSGAIEAAWVRSKVMNYNSGYFEWIANAVQYISGFDQSGTPITTTYGAGNATLIMLDISNLILFNQDLLNIAIEQNGINVYPIGYNYQVGDRIRLMQNNTSTWYNQFFDAPVKEQIGLSIVIEALGEYPELLPGTRFEIYNPVTGEVGLNYFEIGDFIPIINGEYSQTSGVFNSGDTYIYKRLIPYTPQIGGSLTQTISIESPSLSDLFPSLANDLGRSWIYDPNLKQVVYEAGIRYSLQYQSGTFINQLSNFQPLNEDTLSPENGLIQKLVNSYIGTSSVLLAIQTSASTSIYIQEQMTRDNQGNIFLSISNGVIGGKSYLSGNIGTSYPESVVEYEGRIYGFADNKSAAFRYSRDGMIEISNYQRISDFKKITKGLQAQTMPTYMFGGFDPVNGEFLLTPVYTKSIEYTVNITEIIGGIPVTIPTIFFKQGRLPQETVTFNEPLGKWTSNYNYPVDMYSKIGGNLFIAFNNGTLWLQDQNSVCNNFFGVQYNSQISIVFHILPKTIKAWIVAGMKSTDAWDWNPITNVPDFYSPSGQLTSILATQFQNLEGVFWSEMPRDANTPYVANPLIEGQPMRSEILYAILTNTVITKSILYHIIARALFSVPTQRPQYVLPNRV